MMAGMVVDSLALALLSVAHARSLLRGHSGLWLVLPLVPIGVSLLMFIVVFVTLDAVANPRGLAYSKSDRLADSVAPSCAPAAAAAEAPAAAAAAPAPAPAPASDGGWVSVAVRWAPRTGSFILVACLAFYLHWARQFLAADSMLQLFPGASWQ
jgi:hypothetical protein